MVRSGRSLLVDNRSHLTSDTDEYLADLRYASYSRPLLILIQDIDRQSSVIITRTNLPWEISASPIT